MGCHIPRYSPLNGKGIPFFLMIPSNSHSNALLCPDDTSSTVMLISFNVLKQIMYQLN